MWPDLWIQYKSKVEKHMKGNKINRIGTNKWKYLVYIYVPILKWEEKVAKMHKSRLW